MKIIFTKSMLRVRPKDLTRHFFVFITLFILTEGVFSQVVITPPAIPKGVNPTAIQLMYGMFTNTENKDLNVKIHMIVADKGQPVTNVKTKAFILPPGLTMINAVNAEELLYPVDVKYADKKYLAYGIKTSTLMPGTYEICITVLDAASEEILGKNCYTIAIENFTSVNLLTPMNNSESKNLYPIFTWSRVSGSTSAFGDDVYYTLKIVEVINEQSDVIAMQSNPAIFKEDQISFNLFQYPITSQPLGPCKKYAWQIEVFQGIGANKRNLIKSEIWSFRVECEKEIQWTPNGQPPPEDSLKKSPKKPIENPKIVKTDNLKDSTSCKNYKVAFNKVQQMDSFSYWVEITNNYTGSDSNFTPQSIKIKIEDVSILGVDSTADGWAMKQSIIPPNAVDIKWTIFKGYIPNGKINLGNVKFANTGASRFKIIYEWLNKNDKTICKDSALFIQVQYYYDLTEEPNDNYSELDNTTLSFQFINNNAANSNLKITISDVGANKLVKSINEKSVKLNSISGLNRFTLNLKDYKLEPNKLYQLSVSDYTANHRFNFKITDKITSAREK